MKVLSKGQTVAASSFNKRQPSKLQEALILGQLVIAALDYRFFQVMSHCHFAMLKT